MRRTGADAACRIDHLPVARKRPRLIGGDENAVCLPSEPAPRLSGDGDAVVADRCGIHGLRALGWIHLTPARTQAGSLGAAPARPVIPFWLGITSADSQPRAAGEPIPAVACAGRLGAGKFGQRVLTGEVRGPKMSSSSRLIMSRQESSDAGRFVRPANSTEPGSLPATEWFGFFVFLPGVGCRS